MAEKERKPNAKNSKPGEYAHQHIPKQALGQSTNLVHKQTTGQRVNQEKTQVVVKQTPVPEVRIYGQTSPKKHSMGMKASDNLAKWAGSWKFIGSFMVFLVIWMIINFYAIINVWDPYPFILLNLVLSCLAAIQAPVILMSQNRAADRDRAKAERDYAVNRKAEREAELIMKDLDYIKKRLAEIHARVK
jgi:uncharacterized membrane protein